MFDVVFIHKLFNKMSGRIITRKIHLGAIPLGFTDSGKTSDASVIMILNLSVLFTIWQE